MTFKDSLKAKDFVVTAHVNLAEAPDADSLIRQGKMLSPVVDAVQLTDNKSVQIQMSSVVAAALLIQQGIDPIVHMACRDRNRIALEKDLIGAAALGVSSVLVMRGKKIPKSKKLGVRNVFDTPALEFMTYIQELTQSENALLAPDFLIGTNAEVFDPDPDWTPRNLIRKCDAGAQFRSMPALLRYGRGPQLHDLHDRGETATQSQFHYGVVTFAICRGGALGAG